MKWAAEVSCKKYPSQQAWDTFAEMCESHKIDFSSNFGHMPPWEEPFVVTLSLTPLEPLTDPFLKMEFRKSLEESGLMKEVLSIRFYAL